MNLSENNKCKYFEHPVRQTNLLHTTNDGRCGIDAIYQTVKYHNLDNSDSLYQFCQKYQINYEDYNWKSDNELAYNM